MEPKRTPEKNTTYVTPFDLERAIMRTKLELMDKFDEELQARGMPVANRAAESAAPYGKRRRKSGPPENSQTSSPTPAR